MPWSKQTNKQKKLIIIQCTPIDIYYKTVKPSNHFRFLKRALALFSTLNKMAISKFWLDVSGKMVGVRGVLIFLQSLSIIKKGTSPFNFQSNEPFWSFHNKAFNKHLICSQGITYNPCPEGWGEAVILKDLISRTFCNVEQNGYLKILIGCVWGKGGRERGIVALKSLSTIKKGTSPFNFQSNEPFLKFLLRQRLL